MSGKARKTTRLLLTIMAGNVILGCCGGCSSGPTDSLPGKTSSGNTTDQVTFSWQNPSLYGKAVDGNRGLRDPFIVKDGDFWYMTGTMAPYWDSETEKPKGVPLYKSQDLQNWTFVGIMVARPETEDKWYQGRFWAPEIFQHNGIYYITVNCCSKNGDNHGFLVASANHIEGPYTVLTEEEPLLYGNDAHLFVDDDGKVYLYGSAILGAQIDLATLSFLSPWKSQVEPVKGSDRWNGEREGVSFEGPYVLKRNGAYYLFYSTWSRGYEVGVAYSQEPLSGWQLYDNPLYGGINRASCEQYGGIYEEGYYVAQDKYREVGHNSVFLGPDGGDWIVAHAFDYEEGGVKYVMDRLDFPEEGGVLVRDTENDQPVNGPTFGEREAVFSQPGKASPVKALDIWGMGYRDQHYDLPEKIDILFDNGWREAYPVTWSDQINTSSVGTKTVVGTVIYQGTEFPCTATVQVRRARPNT